MRTFHIFAISIPNLDQFHSKTVALALALVTCTSFFTLRLKAEGEHRAASSAEAHSVADYSDPIKTYKTFLEAIKRDDLAAAKACCTISDDNRTGSLDVLVGMWVTFHHFNKVALLKFKDQTSQYLRDGADNEENPYLRGDCTDKALDRTISRLAGSKYKIDGDRANVTIKWNKGDGYPNQTFFYAHEDLTFRKIKGYWKFEIMPQADPEMLVDFLKPGSWGSAFRDGMNLLNAAIEDIESGKLKTWQQVTEELETKGEVLARKWAENHQDPAPEPTKRHTRTKDEKVRKKE
jgi:hypothetical protein